MTETKEALERKTQTNIIDERFKHKMNREAGRAYRIGQVVAYMNEGYSGVQIAEKLGIAESSVRALMQNVKRISKK